jgi:hypothetical protein
MQKIQIPHRFKPRDYQESFLQELDLGKKRAVIVWHRRSGKDKVCFNYMVRNAMEKVGTYFYMLPTRVQAKQVIWDNIDNDGFKMLDHIPKEAVKAINGTELKIELVNGSVIQLVPADEFSERGIGTNPIGVVFSEYSVTSPKAWNYLRPILLVNGGWVIFNFTPRGMNHAYNILQIAKNNPNEWFSQVLTVNDTNIITPDQIDSERREGMPEELIQQEYYCKFVEGGANFFKRVEENVWNEPGWTPKELAQFQIGVDLAKFHDYTVITRFDLSTFRALPQDRFNQIDYNLQKARIENTYLKSNRGRVIIDSTGVGEPIYDDLYARGIHVEPFRFNQKSRMDLLRKLQILLEQDRIKIPNDPILIAELKSMQYQLSPAGNLTVQVPDGLHDDCIMSLALSVWDIPENPIHANMFYYEQTGGVPPMDATIGI